jgi:Domain of unknown function (DUF4345)
MAANDQPLLMTQRIVQLCLFLCAAIAFTGGVLQMSWGQPDTTPRLDNVHRFLAGIYLGSGFIALWAAITVRQQGTLVFLIALAVFLGGCGRLYSMRQVGLPEPTAVWLGYLIPELSLPCVIVLAHLISRWQLRGTTELPPLTKH